MANIALEVASPLLYGDTVDACREFLAAEGFGVLTEIDLARTLKAKIDVDRDPYMILGACHPLSADRLISAMPEMGVLLPCNVTVSDEEGTVWVRAMDPSAAIDGLVSLDDDEHAATVRDVAADITTRLRRVLESVQGAG